MIKVEGVVKRYEGVIALNDVSFRATEGEFVVLMGPSGSGKSTLIHLIAGLDTPSEGRVMVVGREVSSMNSEERAAFRRENVGIIFQQFYLIPYLTALENVMLAQYLHSIPDRDEALNALKQVGLENRAEHLPGQLSGGEQQRVAIARAIINDPKVILADEPTGNLDAENEEAVLEIFKNLKDDGKILIVATHNSEVAEAGDRILYLHHGMVENKS